MSRLGLGKGLAKTPSPSASAAPSGKNLLIVVEGEVTEKVYFACVRKKLELSAAQFEIIPHGSTNPRDLVDRALKEKHRRIKEDKRRDSLVAGIKYDDDSLWVVFDTDAPASLGHLAAGLAYAAAKGVRVASTTPSFEYWLALHLVSDAPLLTTAAHAEAHLNHLLRPHGKSYTKRQAESAALALMPWFVGTPGPGFPSKIPEALRHADIVRKTRSTGANTACSDVDTLFEHLLATALPHHREKLSPSARTPPSRSRPNR